MPIAPEYLHLVYPGPFLAYLYGRNSVDPKKKGRSVQDQLHAGRRLCETYGWPIVGVFDKDVGRSASRHARRTRSDFEAMLEGIEAGKCRIVVAFEASRYYRDLEVYVRLRNACAANGVLLCYDGTIYDLSKREDRKATAQDALQAEDEVEGIRERNLRTMRSIAEKGRPHGRPLYGYTRRYDPDTGDLVDQFPDPVQGPVVTDIFKRVASLESSYSIVRDLNKRGDTGRIWEERHISQLVRNPSYFGRRIFQGRDFGPATWEPLVDEETWYAVQAILRRPGRNTTDDRTVKHLLSYIGLCGECSGAVKLKILKCRGYLAYQCSERFDTVIRKEKLDAYVEEAVIAWLGSAEAVAAFQPADASASAASLRKLENLKNQLNEARQAAARFDENGVPLLSIVSLAALEAQLVPMITQVENEEAPSPTPPLVRGLVGHPNVEEAWSRLLLPQQREVIRKVVTVRLFRARSRGVRTIEPGRIKLAFVGQPGFTSD
ncbi:recombinase family protein [Streptomyces mobaraensis]|uniref:Recombinase family protein n=1 Tax=Streptomyces mobaraensis TaxID=35621 RepID=A0A5N5WCZ6_STRMB|nr:recombinase family protein [Streptomyces mobaraensis]KAB7850201.1 recombinase family protein [Streptomyces mobaraensis]